MTKKNVIMFVLYLVLICNVVGMLIYFYKGFQENPPIFIVREF
jgi:hypothetical protein